MSSKPPPLQPGLFYHLHARGNNRENIFIEERNYAYFLALYTKHFAPVADTYAYCLMRNHFHFLVQLHEPREAISKPQQTPGVSENPWGLSQRFSNFLNAYAKAINRAYNRTGSLFQNRFGREVVDSDAYFLNLVAYIHRNPQHHHFVDDFREWPYSSYHTLLSEKESRLSRDEVLGWFGDRASFADFHQRELELIPIAQFIVDDID